MILKNHNNTNIENIYSRPPICFKEGIPVFSEENEYIKNYEKIAQDQLEGIQKTGENPFIPEEIWAQSEDSTRSLISKYAKAGDRILDVGVGLGRLLGDFHHLNRYGMDISLEFLKVAKSKGINVCCSLIEDMPYKENIFDIVVCTDVLEHVLDINFVCRKIFSVLKKDGVLIIRAPYREDLSPYLERTYPYKFAHLRNFDEHSLRLLFTKIFSCQFLECNKAAYSPIMVNKFKFYTRRFSIIRRNTNRLIHASKFMSNKLHDYLLKLFYNPIEINMVFRKTI